MNNGTQYPLITDEQRIKCGKAWYKTPAAIAQYGSEAAAQAACQKFLETLPQMTSRSGKSYSGTGGIYHKRKTHKKRTNKRKTNKKSRRAK